MTGLNARLTAADRHNRSRGSDKRRLGSAGLVVVGTLLMLASWTIQAQAPATPPAAAAGATHQYIMVLKEAKDLAADPKQVGSQKIVEPDLAKLGGRLDAQWKNR